MTMREWTCLHSTPAGVFLARARPRGGRPGSRDRRYPPPPALRHAREDFCPRIGQGVPHDASRLSTISVRYPVTGAARATCVGGVSRAGRPAGALGACLRNPAARLVPTSDGIFGPCHRTPGCEHSDDGLTRRAGIRALGVRRPVRSRRHPQFGGSGQERTWPSRGKAVCRRRSGFRKGCKQKTVRPTVRAFIVPGSGPAGQPGQRLGEGQGTAPDPAVRALPRGGPRGGACRRSRTRGLGISTRRRGRAWGGPGFGGPDCRT